jgi:methylthioribose-1-phosphate isomerase
MWIGLAKRHNVPFMVVAPVTTVDLSLSTGAEYVLSPPLVPS